MLVLTSGYGQQSLPFGAYCLRARLLSVMHESFTAALWSVYGITLSIYPSVSLLACCGTVCGVSKKSFSQSVDICHLLISFVVCQLFLFCLMFSLWKFVQPPYPLHYLPILFFQDLYGQRNNFHPKQPLSEVCLSPPVC